MTDAAEYGWVIETANHTSDGPLLYWDGNFWTSNNQRAVRFCRKVDADRIMMTLEPAAQTPLMRTAEHGWMHE